MNSEPELQNKNGKIIKWKDYYPLIHNVFMVKFRYGLDLTNLTLFYKIFYSILLLVVPISLQGNVWVKNVSGLEKGMWVRNVINL